MARPIIGLDIGSSYVKAIQLKRGGRNAIELEKFGIAEVNPDGPPPTGAAAIQAKVKAIQAAMSNGRISGKQVITSVSGEAIIVRYIQLPNMPENELREALKWEAEEYIPFNLNEVNIDSTILGRSSDGSMVNVLLVAAKKELINEHIEIIRQANLATSEIDVDSFAYLNCYEYNCEPDPSKVVGLVNIGATTTNINVYHSGVSHFSRDIAIAGNTITKSLMSKMGKEFVEAEQMKIVEGAPTPSMAVAGGVSGGGGDGGEETGTLLDTIRGTVEKLTGANIDEEAPEEIAGKIIKSTLDNLMSEIRRSIQFFENQASGRRVEQIVLSGGTARMNRLDEYIHGELNIPVEVLNPLQRIQPKGRDLDVAKLEENKSLLGVGIGLALRKVID